MVVFLRRKSVLLTPFSDARCSKRPDFSPAQPWRAEARLFPNKAAAPQVTLVSRFTVHGSWERCENAAGGFFQHPARGGRE
jgi:hypothetical protein